jgi:hypothetical protein
LSFVVSYLSHACLNVSRPLRRAISSAKPFIARNIFGNYLACQSFSASI